MCFWQHTLWENGQVYWDRCLTAHTLWTLTHLSLCTSLSLCLSSVLTNFCFHNAHKFILFISSLTLYNTSYLLLLKSSSLPSILTTPTVKFSSHCVTFPFNLMVFTVSVVSYTYPKTQVFTSLVFNKFVLLTWFLNYFSMSKLHFLHSI